MLTYQIENILKGWPTLYGHPFFYYTFYLNLPEYNISVVWHFGKNTWLKFRRGRLVNSGKLLYFSYPQLHKMRKLDQIISKIAAIF